MIKTYDIKAFSFGESVVEATVAWWLKKKGDSVKADEILVELETDKVTLEVNSPTSGYLCEIHYEADSTVVVGGVLGKIAETEANTFYDNTFFVHNTSYFFRSIYYLSY